MGILLTLLYFALSCASLLLSGFILVKCTVYISKFLKMSEFVFGFMIMSVSTSLPELFVGITSSLSGVPGISLGTVIGSNIVDLTFVAGMTILMAGNAKIVYKKVSSQSWWMLLFAVLPIVFMLVGDGISRFEGGVLVVLFAFWMYHMYKQRQDHNQQLENGVNKYVVILATLGFIASLALMFYSAKMTVFYGSELALGLMLPVIFVGLFFVSLGTSLPELVFESITMSRGHSGFAFGDLIGSVVTNSTLVIGITSLILPISANKFLFFTSSMFLVFVCILFIAFLQGKKLTKIHGISLIFLYILFLIIELTIRGVIPTISTF